MTSLELLQRLLEMSVASTAAWGLGLGRLNVQSALGETLSAEIDIAAITPEEAGTLRVRVAPPEAYRATGGWQGDFWRD